MVEKTIEFIQDYLNDYNDKKISAELALQLISDAIGELTGIYTLNLDLSQMDISDIYEKINP